ncbi:MAG: hypothetical protein ACTHN5_17970 [Phycisphaerae bacterium]
MPDISRRDALKTTAALTLAALAPSTSAQSSPPQPAPTPKPKPTIGIQTGLPPLASNDLDKSLDLMQSRGCVNTLFPFIYTYTQSTAAMQAFKNFRGGNFAIPHMQYYKNVPLTYDQMRAPDFGDTDLLARTIPIAKKHGMKTFAWILEDHSHCPLPAWEPLYEIDFHGRRALKHPAGPCYNNPAYIAFALALVEDYTRSYDIDGLMWANERQGGFFNALGAWAGGGSSDPGKATCFCEFCTKKAKNQGIDPERAKAGFSALEQYVREGRAKKRPRDGYFVTFFRLLLQYPELLAWENLWTSSRFQLQSQIYKLVKSIKPDLPVGTHIWHTVSFSPFHRAEMDYAQIAQFTDFIKPVLYNNCAGERMKGCIASTTQNVFGDIPPADALQTFYDFLNYNEAPYDKLAAAGFSPDYVQRETQRCVDGAGPGKDVWPGIDIDVPVHPGSSQSTAEGVKQAVLAAFKGGATGLILSRNYPEMNPEHLAGAGAALDELRLR